MKIAPYMAEAAHELYTRQQRVGERIAAQRAREKAAEGAQSPGTPPSPPPPLLASGSERARFILDLSGTLSRQIGGFGAPGGEAHLNRLLGPLGLRVERDRESGRARLVRADTGELIRELDAETENVFGRELRGVLERLLVDMMA